jgi:hypothetical protein
VLAELLNGTHFNYVMVGSTSDPKAIQSIVLTPRTSGPDTPMTATNRPGGPQGSFGQPAVINSGPADADNDGAEEADAPAEDDAPQAEQQNQQNQQNNNNNNGQPATPKTPEQLLQELQRQQQQMQQQQNPQPGQNGQPGQPGQNSQTPPGILPNQPPTGAAPTPTKPE